MDGPTSTFEAAYQLGKLCENRHLVVNLIPYNKTDVKDKLSCPPELHIKKFQDIVTSYGVFCFIRRTMGADIAGACGQLVIDKKERTISCGDIEDVGLSHKYEKQKVASNKSVASKNRKRHVGTDNTDRQLDKVFEAENSAIEKGLEKYILPLAAGTAIAATCLLISSFMLVTQRKKRV